MMHLGEAHLLRRMRKYAPRLCALAARVNSQENINATAERQIKHRWNQGKTG